ncbi:hypothetical protein NliqN6_5518 [Naganishia liquefaciens]|uniref:Uncharacterized protein n=1 Tax=Naganishia liquefaciens TaxID=104408 RepID=A0A8H3TWY3_9TREE|nr:hypothetical protein NliqN6_5518 [Naganishia liquefaciens]
MADSLAQLSTLSGGGQGSETRLQYVQVSASYGPAFILPENFFVNATDESRKALAESLFSAYHPELTRWNPPEEMDLNVDSASTAYLEGNASASTVHRLTFPVARNLASRIACAPIVTLLAYRINEGKLTFFLQKPCGEERDWDATASGGMSSGCNPTDAMYNEAQEEANLSKSFLENNMR